MDREQLLELVPHYVALVILVFGVLAVLEAAVGDLNFWVELAVIFVIAAAYRPVVTRLGIAPAQWEE